jgi:hypothetical protein
MLKGVSCNSHNVDTGYNISGEKINVKPGYIVEAHA